MTEEQKQQERERIGKRISELRKAVEWKDAIGITKHGISQAQLGTLCGLAGSHIARIEKGRYSVGFDTLQTIAEALGYDVDFTKKQ